MRFMLLLKANAQTEAGVPPSAELIAAMGRYNEEMVKAGVLLAGEGLQPTAKGARVRFSGPSRTVTLGPFDASKDLLAGFWLIQVPSREAAIEWVKRCPHPHAVGEAEIEIRQVFEAADFPADVFPPEEVAREEALRAEMAKKGGPRA